MSFPDLPSDVIISNLQIAHDTPNFYNESLDYTSDVKSRGIHRITGSFDVHMSDDTTKRVFEAFLLTIRGRYKPFYLQLGNRFESQTVSSTQTTISGYTTKGSTQVLIDNVFGTIKTGDLFTVQNDTKMHMALIDTKFDETLDFFPALRKDIPDQALLNFKDPKLLVRLTTDMPAISYSESGIVHTMTMEFEEYLGQ